MNELAADAYSSVIGTAVCVMHCPTFTSRGPSLPSTAESAAHGAATGSVRRFWWRTSQPARLAIGCFGVVTALAATGAVAFSGDGFPRERGGAGLEASEYRGDSIQVTVNVVSDVDLF